MVLGKFECQAVILISMIEGQGPTVLAVGAVGVVLIFSLSHIVSLFFLFLSGRRLDIEQNSV